MQLGRLCPKRDSIDGTIQDVGKCRAVEVCVDVQVGTQRLARPPLLHVATLGSVRSVSCVGMDFDVLFRSAVL